ncbi:MULTISPECIES: hypothetical protein [Brasilonema]|uniref:hypothetical protein n=1 Tax=Brasilonema TaxID=383614 RepID=UPI00296F97FB|nr:hypothetical protein [Brasilonema sennae]
MNDYLLKKLNRHAFALGGALPIAIEHNLTVVSADSDFDRIQQVRTLSLESWL